ncbi:hypothetical protein [Thermoflavifilum thermophilum]|uniref:Uncharacterized protein n=1 Tax=Thermoflavifilum thermophilum TaxID=1393122 RepID=A0A1I7NGX9_9BACT|nr:hypothetical protein [Thermoflavifilum thermophilum]SFV33873.1 hypothetical protein SAMN05660895_1838 [Thermoflavifilum thermophilum]
MIFIFRRLTANKPIFRQIESLVDKILEAKKVRAYRNTPQPDTSEWEREIDRLVYRLYDLTDDEKKIIENQK